MTSHTSILRSDGPLWQFLTSPEGKALTLTALMLMTAGCSGLTGGDDGGGSQGAPINDIPEGVDVVMHFESGVLQDSTTEQLMNGLIDMQSTQASGTEGDQPENWSEVLREFENKSDLSVEGFHGMTVFGKSSGLAPSSQGMNENSQDGNSENQDYAGAIMQTDWTWQEMMEASNQDSSTFSEETYQGVTVYVNESTEAVEQVDGTSWVADMGNGKYAMGTKEVVQDIIDTNQGNMAAFSGDIRQAYENTPDGYMKMAANVTDRATQAATNAAGGGMMMGASSAQGVEVMTMAYHTNGGQMTMEMQMQMRTQQAAENITGLKTLASTITSSEGPTTPGENPAAWALDTLELEQNGNVVNVRFGATPEELLELFEGMDQKQSSDSGVDFSIGQSERLAG